MPTPNSRKLWIALGVPLPDNPEEAPIILPPTLYFQHTTFPMINDVPVRVLYEHDTLGVILYYCYDIDRVYLKKHHFDKILFQNKGLEK